MTTILEHRHGTALDQPLTAATTLPRVPYSARDARHWIIGVLTAWGVPEGERETAELLVSELVANAVKHAQGDGDTTITAAWHLGAVRITVSDPDGDHRAPAGHGHAVDTDSEDGRGLLIVRALADSYAVECTPFGKVTRVVLNTGGAR